MRPGAQPGSKPGQPAPRPGQPAPKPGQRPIPPQMQKGARPMTPPQNGAKGTTQPTLQRRPVNTAPSQNTTK
jgi:hypothetical protein